MAAGLWSKSSLGSQYESWDGLGYRFSDFVFAGCDPFRYRYDIKYDTLATENGVITYVSKIEEKKEMLGAEDGFKRDFYRGASNGYNMASIPTDNEIRPVNVAVKFMIKAK